MHRIALFSITLVLALAAFEGLCRLLDVDFNPHAHWQYHPELGWTQARSKTFIERKHGENVIVQFNALGFRDLDHSFDKPQGVRRIVIVGDSFSEALQVNLEDTYWWRLQLLLNGGQTGPWEVINLGVGDYGSMQELMALREYGLRFAPDIVISQIFPLNDICNNTLELAGLCKSRNDRYRPYPAIRQGQLVAVWSQPTRHKLRSSLVSFGVLERAYLQFVAQETGQVQERQHQARIAQRGLPADPLIYTLARDENQIEVVRRGWSMTERVLEETARECRQHGIPWLPVAIPFHARIRTAFPEFQRSYPHVPLARDYPELRLRRFFHRLEVPSVMALEIFDEYPHLALPPRGGHLNPNAHRLVAQAIYRQLIDSQWVEPATNREEGESQ